MGGVGEKPKGARFYPLDMTKEEFETWHDVAGKDMYAMVRRDGKGRLKAIPYHVYFKPEVERAAMLLREAAAITDEPDLRTYLLARAKALLTDDYAASDIAWLDMRDNSIDVIIGPIETYEDELFGYKAAHTCYIAVRDLAWSRRLERFSSLLPDLQRGLPVDARYKAEAPGSDAQIGAYDAIYYAGDCNAGSKTIAVNLPNDEALQLRKGTRRLQFKNVMRAKFDPDPRSPSPMYWWRRTSGGTSPSSRSLRRSCSTRWRTGWASRGRSTARHPCGMHCWRSMQHWRKGRRTSSVST